MGCNHDCSSCSSNCGGEGIQKLILNDKSSIKRIVGVLSGKGGVGKSMVTSLLASLMAKRGFKVGVLDADITGPSMAKSFGIKEKAYQQDGLILPYVTPNGIKVISTNMLLPNDDDPILWRGSLIVSLVSQFYKDVNWGELDVLFIDMPPGTGDVSLSTFQQIPVDELIMVTTPQNLVSMIVKKSLNMAHEMDINVLGIVENMSYVTCPNCDEHIYIYGHKEKEEIEAEYNEKLLARIPFDAEMTRCVDEGKVEEIDRNYLDYALDCIASLIRGN